MQMHFKRETYLNHAIQFKVSALSYMEMYS